MSMRRHRRGVRGGLAASVAILAMVWGARLAGVRATAAQTPQATPASPAEAPSSTSDVQTVAATNVPIADRATALHGAWAIEWRSIDGAESTSQPDVLTFDQTTMTSQALAAEGYAATSYSIVTDPTSLSWESLQTKTDEGVVFWRGQVRGDSMEGVMSRHPLIGESQEYQFVGHRGAPTTGTAELGATGEAQVSTATASAQVVVPVQADSPVRPATTQVPRRKGWFRWW